MKKNNNFKNETSNNTNNKKKVYNETLEAKLRNKLSLIYGLADMILLTEEKPEKILEIKSLLIKQAKQVVANKETIDLLLEEIEAKTCRYNDIKNDIKMTNGILEKKEEKWFVKWSDLHSFGHGQHWVYTPLHPDEIIDETKLKDGDKVEYEFVDDFNEKTFVPFKYVNKILKQKQTK